MRLGVLDEFLDVILRQTGGAGDRDLLLLAGAEVFRRHVHDAVRVDVERDLDLRQAARRGRNAHQVERAEKLVAARHLALALEDLDLDRRLIVGGRGERLRLARRDGGVALDELRHHAAERLDAERQRSDVEQEHVLDVAAENAALNRGADRHHFVGIHALVRLLAEVVLHDLLHERNARRAADENHLVDVLRRHPRVLERLLERTHGAIDDVSDELLELGARQRHVQMLRPRGVGGDERKIDVGRHGRRQLDLRLLPCLLETLQRHFVFRQIDALILLEFVDDPVDEALVDVVAAEVCVTVGRLDFDDAFADFEDRDVERAAAEVVDGDGLVTLLVQAVRQRGGRRLVDEALDLEAGDLARVFRRLALRVVEVGRDGDDRAVHFLAEVVFRGLFELLKNHRGDLGRRIELSLDLDTGVAVGGARHLVRHHLHLFAHFVVLPTHEALDGEDGVFRIGDGLALCNLADQPLAVLGESNDRGGDAAPLRVDDDLRLVAFHDRDHGVRGSEVNADDLCHNLISLCDLE